MLKLSRRDLVVASMAIAVTFCATALSQSKLPTMKSSVFDWNTIVMEKTEKGGGESFLTLAPRRLTSWKCM